MRYSLANIWNSSHQSVPRVCIQISDGAAAKRLTKHSQQYLCISVLNLA